MVAELQTVSREACTAMIEHAYAIADALCGRRQFYEYRTEFITLVAQAMDMLPGGSRAGEEGGQ